MKKLLMQLLIAMCSLGLLFTSVSASAYCRWVPKHVENGVLVRGHQVCGYHHHDGYRHRHCGWRHGHRVCWY